MPDDFFSTITAAARMPLSMIPKCGACGLYKSCKSPKMPYSGKGKKGILIVGDLPSHFDDEAGKHFTDPFWAGRLHSSLRKFGIDLRQDCWSTNAFICHPKGEHVPKHLVGKVADYCRPNLLNTIEELKPEKVLLLGEWAVKALIPFLWKDKEVGSIQRWVGWCIPSLKINAWVVPTWHPKEVQADKDRQPVYGIMFDEHIENLVNQRGRPFEGPNSPDKEKVHIILDDEKAARWIKKFERKGGDLAFDYETNMLKPDSEDGRILCASICWRGRVTIAFPWFGKAVAAMASLLGSDSTRKFSHNLKFEERWTRAKVVPSGVNNWGYCSMQGTHVLDNRQGVTSLKFQSFVMLGRQSYDDHIKPFIGAKKGGGYSKNKMHKLGLEQMLLYCGLDSLYDYWLCQKQMKQLGIE